MEFLNYYQNILKERDDDLKTKKVLLNQKKNSRAKKYYQKNKNIILKRNRIYQIKNKDIIKEKKRIYDKKRLKKKIDLKNK